MHPVRTSQETHYVSATKPNRLILFGETFAVYCEIHTKYIHTLCEQNAGFLHVKAGGMYAFKQWLTTFNPRLLSYE
jgi:hypothetical protein